MRGKRHLCSARPFPELGTQVFIAFLSCKNERPRVRKDKYKQLEEERGSTSDGFELTCEALSSNLRTTLTKKYA
jgi:hypothetical protein